MGEVKGLSLELGLDGRPGLGLGGIREKVHDDGTTRDSLVHLEQVLAGDPSILDSLVPRSSVLSDTDNDVEAVVAEVKTLTVALMRRELLGIDQTEGLQLQQLTLRPVTNQSKGVILEVVL